MNDIGAASDSGSQGGLTAANGEQAPAELHITGGYCLHCDWPSDEVPPKAEVVRADVNEYGWLAAGRMPSREFVGFCGSCGAAYAEIQRAVPVELAEYPCPKCEGRDALRYQVLRVELLDDEYVFVASAECTNCSHRTGFRRVLDALGRITRLKVGPTGIEIETSQGKQSE